MEDRSPPRGCDASRDADTDMADSNTITIAIETIEAFVQEIKWPARLQSMWNEVKQAAQGSAPTRSENASNDDITDLKTQMKSLTELVKGLAKAPNRAPSYAEALKQGISQLPSKTEMPVPARRSREVTIAPGGENASQKSRSGRELVRDLNAQLEGEPVIAARRLPSGDVLVTFATEESKKKWETTPTLIAAFGAGARSRRKEYTVIAHGITVASIDPRDQEKAIKGIFSQNPTLKGKVEFIRVGWSRKTISKHKKAGPLHIGVAEPEQANYLVDNGLLYGSELHDCEVFYGDCQVTQCFQCQAYGHTAKHCRNVIRCGFCAAAGHKSGDCPKKDDSQAHRCAVCKGLPKHTAWARECPIRKAKAAAARQAYLNRPSRFQVRKKHREETPEPLSTPMESTPTSTTAETEDNQGSQQTIATNFTNSQDLTVFRGSEIDEDEPQPKRKRGRPSSYELLRRPTPGARDIRTLLPLTTQNE